MTFTGYKNRKQEILKYLVVIYLFLSNLSIYAQGQFMAIDSLYLSTISSFYKNTENKKDAIWKGMKLAPVCLYRINGPALLYNHPNPSGNFKKVTDKLYLGEQKDLQLFGATQMEINGTLTAIVDYGLVRYSNTVEVYAELFHELHHVYQRNSFKQIGFDNPAILLTYPENYENDGIKLYEQNLLYRMCFEKNTETFKKLLNQFYSCRIKRESIIGTYIKYEKSVENTEGPAFFCEYKNYDMFAPFDKETKDNYNQKHFFSILTNSFYGRENLRKRHLASGLAMCIILDKYFNNWQVEYYSKKTDIFDFFISKFKPEKEELKINKEYFDLSKFHTKQIILNHHISLNKFNSQQGKKITLKFYKYPQFRGFDPMHAESINDTTVLHKTFLRLSGGEKNELFITNKDVVTITDKEIWFVEKVILFVPKQNILIKNNRIMIDIEGVTISWSGEIKMKDENEIIFNCR